MCKRSDFTFWKFVLLFSQAFACVRAFEHEYPIYGPNGYMLNVMMNFREFERWINMKICMRKVEKIYVLLTYVRACVYLLPPLYHSNSPCPQRVSTAWKYKTDWIDGLVKKTFFSLFHTNLVCAHILYFLARFHLEHSFILTHTHDSWRLTFLIWVSFTLHCILLTCYVMPHAPAHTHTFFLRHSRPQYSHLLIRGHSRFTKSLFSVFFFSLFLLLFRLFFMFVLIFIFIFNVLCIHEQDCARQIRGLFVRLLSSNAQNLPSKKQQRRPRNANKTISNVHNSMQWQK